MTAVQKKRDIVIIYDGECGFCKECVRWVEKRAVVTALPFQSADLARYGLTYDRCSKEVVAIINGKVFGGADAVAKLLRVSGHKNLGTIVKLSGPIGRNAYKWVAANRNSRVVHAIHLLVKLFNR
jgi:predicted DCC family thiol-disulfide oxidoreductase YuxK